MAVADRMGSEGWKALGTVPGGWFENSEFIRIDGKWYLFATDKMHLPFLREMQGTGDRDEDWINWGAFKRLHIPLQGFNTEERANCSYLIDLRSQDGYFYLLYSGRNQGLFHEGDKHFKLAIARAKDLKKWEPAGKE